MVDHRGGTPRRGYRTPLRGYGTASRLWVMGRPLSGLLAMGRGKAAIGYRQGNGCTKV